MKKIIATAVMSAFVAPAMAAEVTIGGDVEFIYKMPSSADQKSTMVNNDNLIYVTGTEELPNGMSVSGNLVMGTDSGDSQDIENDGTNLTISGAFGSVTVGDASGALDSTGDWTDIGSTGGTYAADGTDAAILYMLPAIGGFQVAASMSPEGESTHLGSGDQVATDATSYAITYTVGDMGAYYGSESFLGKDGTETTRGSYGVKMTMGAIYVAAEAGKAENEAKTQEVAYQGIAGSYTMGDIVVGFEKQETEVKAGTAGSEHIASAAGDTTLLFAEYNLGSAVDVYVATIDNKEAASNKQKETRVGVEYNF